MCLLILPSQCCLVQGRIKELGSSSVRQWKGATADPLWVRHNILALPGLGSVQTLPALEASFQLWELVEVQWWKLGCWAPPLLSAGAGDPINTLSFTTAVPGAWPQLHRRTAAGKFIAHAEPALKDNFPTIVPSFIVFSASSASRCSICNGRCSMAGSPWG